jgi:hypothetical protein
MVPCVPTSRTRSSAVTSAATPLLPRFRNGGFTALLAAPMQGAAATSCFSSLIRRRAFLHAPSFAGRLSDAQLGNLERGRRVGWGTGCRRIRIRGWMPVLLAICRWAPMGIGPMSAIYPRRGFMRLRSRIRGIADTPHRRRVGRVRRWGRWTSLSRSGRAYASLPAQLSSTVPRHKLSILQRTRRTGTAQRARSSQELESLFTGRGAGNVIKVLWAPTGTRIFGSGP